MRNSLTIFASSKAFWQSVCLLGTASIDCGPFLFLDTKFDWNPDVSSIFLLLPLLAVVTELRELPLALVFGAMIA